MRVWLTPVDKHPRTTEMVYEGKGNLECSVGREVKVYQFRPCDQVQCGEGHSSH